MFYPHYDRIESGMKIIPMLHTLSSCDGVVFCLMIVKKILGASWSYDEYIYIYYIYI